MLSIGNESFVERLETRLVAWYFNASKIWSRRRSRLARVEYLIANFVSPSCQNPVFYVLNEDKWSFSISVMGALPFRESRTTVTDCCPLWKTTGWLARQPTYGNWQMASWLLGPCLYPVGPWLSRWDQKKVEHRRGKGVWGYDVLRQACG